LHLPQAGAVTPSIILVGAPQPEQTVTLMLRSSLLPARDRGVLRETICPQQRASKERK